MYLIMKTRTLRWGKFDEAHWFPLQPVTHVEDIPKLPEQFKMQNIHPHLALYDPTIQTDFLSHDNLCVILNSEDETELLKLLSETGVIAKSQQREFCGGEMHHEKQGENWFWVCKRRVTGRKCNRGKFSVYAGYNLDRMAFRSQFNIGQKNCKTVVQWYAKCREVWEPNPNLEVMEKL